MLQANNITMNSSAVVNCSISIFKCVFYASGSHQVKRCVQQPRWTV